MKRCTKCLYPETTRPFIHFDDDGVCSGCRVHEEKEKIDWDERKKQLDKIADNYRGEYGYDCIIPVSGGKDSHYQVHYVVNELKLKPLLVTFNHLDNSNVGIRNLENMIVKFGLDHIRFTPSPEVVKKCCRHATKTMADPFWHEHAGIYTFPVTIAVLYKIPLIIWGEYGFADLTGMYSHKDYIEMTKKNRQEHGMRGMEAEDFLEGNEEGLTLRDLEFTMYPTDKEIKEVGIKGIYLSNYIKWNPIEQTKTMIDLYDFCTDTKERTFNKYENVECYFNDSVHDYMKYLKYGYGRATDHASQLIRYGYITRKEGERLVAHFDCSVYDKKFVEFCKWIDMSPNEVLEIIKEHSTVDESDLREYPEEITFQDLSIINRFFECNVSLNRDGRKFI